jgi:glycosyltransferase involved in cell wall biosynthesis
VSRLLLLYRPRLPGQRAQAIQVVHAAEALARRGVEVSLFADRGTAPHTALAALDHLGLAPHPRLHLAIAPAAHSGLAGLWFRRQLARWWSGPPGVVLARDKRRLQEALTRHGPGGHRIVLETHERDGADNPAAHAREAWLLPRLHGLVANCEGTLAAWSAAHNLGTLPTVVAHNAAAPGRAHRGVSPLAEELLVVGSRAPRKGLHRLAAAAALLPLPVRVIGPEDGPALPPLEHAPPLPYREVPLRLARARVLYLPLGDGIFGRELTSPLKLFDYLSTDRPLVAPDQPAVCRALQAAGVSPGTATGVFLHKPDNPDSLAHAVAAAAQAPPRPPSLRTWDDRLDELLPVLWPGGAP